MKFFTNKKIWQKILVVIVLFVFVSFTCIKPVQAGWLELTGKLFEPILSFFVAIGDVLIDFLQNSILGLGNAFLVIDRGNDFWSWVCAAIAVIAVIGIIVLMCIPRYRTSNWFCSNSCNCINARINSKMGNSNIFCCKNYIMGIVTSWYSITTYKGVASRNFYKSDFYARC